MGTHLASFDPHHIAVRGDNVWVADGTAGLRMFNVQDPTAPQQILHWSGATVTDVHVTDTVAYVAADSQGVVVLDITVPSAPLELGRLEAGMEEIEPASGDDRRVFLSGWRSPLDLLRIDCPQP